MGRIEKRVSALEEQLVGWGTREELLLDHALARLTPEDVLLIGEYLDRDAEPTEDEAAVLQRLERHLNE